MDELSYRLSEGEGRLVDDGRVGVGHRHHHGDATSERSSSATVEVFLVRSARIAKVDVDVDEAGQTNDLLRTQTVDVRLKTRQRHLEVFKRLRTTKNNKQQ